MKLLKPLRELFKLYEREGFTVDRIEKSTKGSHYKIWFHQFPQFVIVSISDIEKPRTIKNSLALYRRLRKQHEEGG